MCFGGNSAKTDRKQTLNAYGAADSNINNLTNIGANAGTDLGKASSYQADVLSGNPNRVAAATAPVSDAVRQQQEQARASIVANGNRSGGGNAVIQGQKAAGTGATVDAITKSQGGAADALERIGSTEAGASGNAASAANSLASVSNTNRTTSQQIHDAAVKQWTDIIANGLNSQGAQNVLSKIPGLSSVADIAAIGA